MVATHNQQTSKETLSPPITATNPLKDLSTTQQLISSPIKTHTPKAGLNPLTDAAAYLFSVIGKLRLSSSSHQYQDLHKELLEEISHFQENIARLGYNPEYILVCRYILCATLDDIIGDPNGGNQGEWERFSLLATYQQESLQQDKFFSILERAVKEPTLYIDLMEFTYICLSLGYKGQYRTDNQYQLEQITNNLYKHIRAYRGHVTKTLSPVPFKTPRLIRKPTVQASTSLLFIFFVTACIVMSIFIGLGYLMDVISNEAYKNIAQVETRIT